MKHEKVEQHLSKAFLISLVFAVLFGAMAVFVHESLVHSFDYHIISFVQGFENTQLTVIMKFLSWIGSAWVVFVLAILSFLLFKKILMHRSEAVLFIMVVLGSAVLNQILKLLFHRSRPSLHRIAHASGFSFPSGHSMEAVAFYGILAFILWRHTPVLWGRILLIIFSSAMILGIGVSRIYLGVHFPSDVLGGYLCSTFWLALSIAYYKRAKRRGAETLADDIEKTS
ncbi:phosphatase PAP2 family protein [Metabacillus sp. GX 13764]|uniref:phosphatase PAP2 family protein n=1 Tax=Metabacillus kandeliae TaxID=2900151 RepID=UPI001E2C83A1|nr:phosphatase PAP2 family protein [Metabacillus kandeliae]MCD7035640.1 phosphatase PAP2 family protein [Metabacillus kandeliae]